MVTLKANCDGYRWNVKQEIKRLNDEKPLQKQRRNIDMLLMCYESLLFISPGLKNRMSREEKRRLRERIRETQKKCAELYEAWYREEFYEIYK